MIATVTAAMPAVADTSNSIARVYAEQCAFCHGSKGGGDGAASTMLTPRPTSFSRAEYWKSADREKLATAIAKGKPGTGMVPFAGKLSPEEILAMVGYLETFAR